MKERKSSIAYLDNIVIVIYRQFSFAFFIKSFQIAFNLASKLL